jgi:thioredoxin-related protein
MADELKDRVTVRYIQTTVSSDRSIFYQYGIRSLPTLVLAGATGKELSRLTPGVKNAAAVLGLINTIPGS